MGIPTKGVDTIYVILSDKELKKLIVKGVIKGMAIYAIASNLTLLAYKKLKKELDKEIAKEKVEEVVDDEVTTEDSVEE